MKMKENDDIMNSSDIMSVEQTLDDDTKLVERKEVECFKGISYILKTFIS